MGVFAGTERQCTEDEHDDEDENDSQISEFGLSWRLWDALPRVRHCMSRRCFLLLLPRTRGVFQRSGSFQLAPPAFLPRWIRWYPMGNKRMCSLSLIRLHRPRGRKSAK